MKQFALCLLLMGCANSLLAQPTFLRKDIQVADRPRTAVIGDFNGDFRPDILVRSDRVLSVLLNAGDGSFFPVTRLVGLRPPITATFMAVADFTGDGSLDLVEGNTLFFGLSDGTFLPLRTISEASVNRGSHVVTGDFDGDRKADLILSDDDHTVLLFGNGDGTLRLSASIPGRHGPSVADLNNDGLNDLAMCCPATILLSHGDGTLDSPVQDPKLGWGNLVTADFNRDSVPDIATSWGVHLGNGDGTFQELLPYATDPNMKGVDPFPSAAMDFDGDGYLDLVISYGGDSGEVNFVSILRGAGDGKMSPSLEYTVGQQAGATGSADLDGDGRPDLVTINFRSNTVSVLLNQSELVNKTK